MQIFQLVMHPNFLPSEETRDGLEQTPFGAFLVPGVIPEAQVGTTITEKTEQTI